MRRRPGAAQAKQDQAAWSAAIRGLACSWRSACSYWFAVIPRRNCKSILFVLRHQCPCATIKFMQPVELTLNFSREQASLDGKFLRVGGLALRMDPSFHSGFNRFAPSSCGAGYVARYVCGAQLRGAEWVVATLTAEVQLAKPTTSGAPLHPALVRTKAPQLVASKGVRQLGLITAKPAPVPRAAPPSAPASTDDLDDLPF